MTTSDDTNRLQNEDILKDILEVTVGEDPMNAPQTKETEEEGLPGDTEGSDNPVEVANETDEEAILEEEPEAEHDNGIITEDAENENSEEPEDKSIRMRRLLRNMMRDDENDTGSLKDMFNDLQISGEWLKKHWSFLMIVFVCMLLFVTNRYQAQQEIIEEARLKQELNDWKYIWLTQFSELTRSTRQSNIEESLKQRGDSTLKLSKEAPFIIKVK